MLYQKEQWFAWVREAQEEEEANREKEQKKIKQEAALFKRHREKLQARLEKARREEEQKSQDAYLEAAFRERMAMSAEEWDNDETWDPIKDTGHDKRNQYIDLIKHFLWMDVDDADDNDQDPQLKQGLRLQRRLQLQRLLRKLLRRKTARNLPSEARRRPRPRRMPRIPVTLAISVAPRQPTGVKASSWPCKKAIQDP